MWIFDFIAENEEWSFSFLFCFFEQIFYGDMGGELMYDLNLTGSIGLIIGNEGNGVSRLVKEKCDYIASIPMKGDIDSLNASVATGVLAFEIVRQRMGK